MLIDTCQFHLSNWQEVGPMWAILIFVYHELLAYAFSQSHRLDLIFCLNSFPLLTFCFLLVCMVKLKCVPHPSHYKDCFRGIIYNIARLKERTLEPCITGGIWIWKGIWKGEPPPSPSYHDNAVVLHGMNPPEIWRAWFFLP